MSKPFAKVIGDQVVKYPYGYDDLQAEFSEPLSGDINFTQLFSQSRAAADGFELVEVTKDERKSIPLPPEQQPVYTDVPVKVDGVWMIAIVGLENPPPVPNDGKKYLWNIDAGNWQEVPAKYLPPV